MDAGGESVSEIAEQYEDVAAEPSADFNELRTTAKGVARGLNLLRWALITLFGYYLLFFISDFIIKIILKINPDYWIWSHIALQPVKWLIAPLALIGILCIQRARDWPVNRFLVISLIIYFSAMCLWTPWMSIYSIIVWHDLYNSVMPSIRDISLILALGISLAYFVLLPAVFYLAGSINNYFSNNLISKNHRCELLGIGLILYGASVAWWYWELLSGNIALYGRHYSTLSFLFTRIPMTLWLLWILGVMFRIGKKLKRFTKLNCCPQCDYDLRESVESGCPECGWKRSAQSNSTGIAS